MFSAQLENQVWVKLGPERPGRGQESPSRPAVSGTFFCTFFVAFPGNSSNNVDPADPTLFVAFPGNV